MAPPHHRHDDRALAPVVGVALMIVITVVLAAVIGGLAIGLNDAATKTTPTVSLSVEDADEEYIGGVAASTQAAFRITHDHGDDLAVSDLRITVRDPANGSVVVEFTPASVDVGPADVATTSNATLRVTADGTDLETRDDVSVGTVLAVRDGSGVHEAPFVDGAEYRVSVVHQPTGSTLADDTVTLD